MDRRMNEMQFSICLGHADRDPIASDLIESIVRVENGITALAETLHLGSRLELRRHICEEHKEWICVTLHAGNQMTLVDEFEASIGSELTLKDIEGSVLNEQFQKAMSALNTLCRRRVLTSTEFLGCISTLSLSDTLKAITRHLPSDHGVVSWRTVDGITSKTKVPNRLFSSRSDQVFRLNFLPREVGRASATVTVDRESALLINAKNRSMKMIWSTFDEVSPAQSLVQSALDEAWMTAAFHLTYNRNNEPKSLLLQSATSLERDHGLLKPAVVEEFPSRIGH